MTKPFLETLTLGEIAAIETKIGMPISRVEEAPQGKFLMALVVAKKKREGEKFTDNDAASYDMNEAMEYLGMATDDDEDADPNA